MNICLINDRYIVFSVESEKTMDKFEAEAVVRSLLHDKGLPYWKKIHIDMFSSRESILYIAYPEVVLSFSLADYALPFLKEYFTE